MTRHVPEFDTLRALAAFGVMAAHYGPLRGVPIAGKLESRLGSVSVDLFFALSGFLITGILLGCKSIEQPVSSTLRQFYARRFLRIFPLYYLCVLLFAVILVPALPWFLTYTVNIGKTATATSFEPLNHFWTLAVEEQFYIVWPFVVLLCPVGTMLRICWAAAAISALSRLGLFYLGASKAAVTQLTFCCLEPLAIGSAFAVFMIHPVDRRLVAALGVSAGLASCALLTFASTGTLNVAGRAFNAVAFSALIYTVANCSGSAWLAALRTKPLRYLGSISYGLYVWHLPVMWLWPEAGAFGMAGLTIVASAISWHLFEGPLNRLKRHFPYAVPRDYSACAEPA